MMSTNGDSMPLRRHYTQNNDNQHNDIQHNKKAPHSIIMFMLSFTFNFIIPSVIMLSVLMLSVLMLSSVMLTVVTSSFSLTSLINKLECLSVTILLVWPNASGVRPRAYPIHAGRIWYHPQTSD